MLFGSFCVVRGLAGTEPFDLLLPLWSITLINSYLGQLRPSLKHNLNQQHRSAT
jgi:hypothetical protein